MKYQTGKAGRIIVARFADGENILSNLTDIARAENLKAAVFYLIGGMRSGKIVVGPEQDSIPPVPVWKSIDRVHEVVGIGTIFWQGDEPKVHFHGAYGNNESLKMGCLREGGETFLVIEAVITEIEGIDARREFDSETGMTLLRL